VLEAVDAPLDRRRGQADASADLGERRPRVLAQAVEDQQVGVVGRERWARRGRWP
jgi:hypothetical protein